MERFSRERALPDPGAVKTTPCCQTISSNPMCETLGLCSPSADGNVTAWACRSVFRSSGQCQAAGGYIVLKNVRNLLQCWRNHRKHVWGDATERSCLLWHRTLNCHLIHLCGETGMGACHSRHLCPLSWPCGFTTIWIHLGCFRCSSAASSCPVSQAQCLRGHLGFSSWAPRVAAWGLWLLGMVAGWWLPRLALPAALSSVHPALGCRSSAGFHPTACGSDSHRRCSLHSLAGAWLGHHSAHPQLCF